MVMLLEKASSAAPPPEKRSESRITGRRPIRSESQPSTGASIVWLVHSVDWRKP